MDWMNILKQLGLAAIIFAALVFIGMGLKALQKNLVSHLKTSQSIKIIMGRLSTFLRFGILASVAVVSVQFFFDFPWTISAEEFWSLVDRPFFTQGQAQISLVTVVGLLVIIFIAKGSGEIVREMAEQRILKAMKVPESKRFSLISIIRISVTGAVLLIGLAFLGLDLSSIGLLFGVLGVGLGFGLQSTVANVTAGFVILFSHPYREKDYLKLPGDIIGQVVKVKLLYTEVQTLAQETLIVPNASILAGPVHNITFSVDHASCRMDVTVVYGTDVEKALEILLDVGNRNPLRVLEMPPSVFITKLGSIGVELVLFLRVPSTPDRLAAQSWGFREIYGLFKKEGIQIASMPYSWQPGI